MINPKELRIGNLIMSSHNSKIFTIESGHDIDILNDVCVPIPPTEKLLLELGFDLLNDIAGDIPEKHYGISIVNGDKDHPEKLVISLPLCECYIGDYDNDDYYIMNEQVVYVHHLQNLYQSLCKTELQLTTK